MTFDPQHMIAQYALNGLRLTALSGQQVSEDISGKYAQQLISTEVLTQLIRDRSHTLGLLPDTDNATVRAYFRVLLDADDANARQIAVQLGRNFALILLTLHHGEAASRQMNPEWPDEYWDYWGAIQHIYLAGGLVVGTVGQVILKTVRQVLADHGVGVRVDIADHPAHLPLIGAARYVDEGARGLALDFGSSYVKRAQLQFSANRLTRMKLLERIPINLDLNAGREDAQRILNRMMTIIAEAVSEDVSNTIPISLSSYVDPQGQPILHDKGGIYMNLRYLSDDVQGMMSDLLTRRVGRSLRVKLLHDGSAAASAYAPQADCAVITIGTSLGIGFPVTRTLPRQIATDLTVIDGRSSFQPTAP